MKTATPRLALATILSLAAAPSSNADPAAGQAIYHSHCAVCHAIAAGQNRIGPTLFGVVGRKAGSLAGYNYSPGLKADGQVWTATTLDPWLANPRAVVPGTKMSFPGLPDPTDRANVIAFMGTLK